MKEARLSDLSDMGVKVSVLFKVDTRTFTNRFYVSGQGASVLAHCGGKLSRPSRRSSVLSELRRRNFWFIQLLTVLRQL